MFLLDPCKPGTRPVEQQNHGSPESADDSRSVAIRLTIGRVVEKNATVEEPAHRLVREESEKSGGQVDDVQMQNIEEKRNATIGLEGPAKPAPESRPTDRQQDEDWPERHEK